jgi:hypothetical protein
MSRSLLDMFLSRRFVRLPLFGVLVSLQFVLVLSVFVLCCGGVFALNFCLDSAREWIDVPRGVGHVNMFALAVLLLPVSRSSPLLFVMRIDVMTAIALHKLVARCFILFVLIHSLTMAIFWAKGSIGNVFANYTLGIGFVSVVFCILLFALLIFLQIESLRSLCCWLCCNNDKFFVVFLRSSSCVRMVLFYASFVCCCCCSGNVTFHGDDGCHNKSSPGFDCVLSHHSSVCVSVRSILSHHCFSTSS